MPIEGATWVRYAYHRTLNNMETCPCHSRSWSGLFQEVTAPNATPQNVVREGVVETEALGWGLNIV